MNRDTEAFLKELLEEDRRQYQDSIEPWLGVSMIIIVLGLALMVYAW